MKYLKRLGAAASGDDVSRRVGQPSSPGGASIRSVLRGCPAGGRAVGTPNQSIIGPEELSDLLADGSFMSSAENSEAIFTELRRQVQRSNELFESSGHLGTILQKISGLLTPPEALLALTQSLQSDDEQVTTFEDCLMR